VAPPLYPDQARVYSIPVLSTGRRRRETLVRGLDGCLVQEIMSTCKIKFVTRGVLAVVLGAGATVASIGAAAASTRSPQHVTFARSSVIEFSGHVTAYIPASADTSGSITLTDEAGTTLNFVTSLATTITQVDGSGSALAINDFATVDTSLPSPSDATSIHFSAAAPVSTSGIVVTYSPATSNTDGSITIARRNRSRVTYAVKSTTSITENGGAGDAIRVGDFATIEAAAAAPNVAQAIAYDPNELLRFYGRVSAYAPAAGATDGSITLSTRGGSQVSFSTTSTTNVTAIDHSVENLVVGDYAIVRVAATSKSDALSVSFFAHHRIVSSGK
jgi:hypothetical protein